MIESAIPTLVLIGVAAVLAPVVAEWSRRFIAVPEVVIQIIFGILLGPYVLDIAHPNNIVTALADFGLTYLMFLAGTELDLSTMRQGHLGRATGSWVTSLALALAVGELLHATGLVLDHTVVALCLTTTALGTLLPILHDNGVLRTPLGPSILSVGAVGEFGPIVAVAVLLTNRDARVTFLLLALFVVVAVAAALLATQVHPPRFVALMRKHLDSTAQLPVRISVLLVVLLVYLADKLSLDVLLGAFAAGVVVRLFIKGEDSPLITSKLEAIGFGFLIPIFFIDSGIKFDLHALIHMPKVLLLVPMFTVIFLLTRSLPTWAFFRGAVTKVEARSLAILSATGLPIIVVITTLGVSEHRMKPQNAAALVAAGMLSVLPTGGPGTSGAPGLPERADGP
jgi:Kef-type K+ transport system membrane component KefB